MEIVNKICNSPEYCKINLEWSSRFCSLGDVWTHFDCHGSGGGMLLASSRESQGCSLMSILQCTEKPPLTKNCLAPDDIPQMIDLTWSRTSFPKQFPAPVTLPLVKRKTGVGGVGFNPRDLRNTRCYILLLEIQSAHYHNKSSKKC